MIIHKLLDDFKRLATWGGGFLMLAITFGWSQRRKGKADAVAEQQEQREENAKEARKTDDEVSKMSEDEHDAIARRNGWMLNDQDENGGV